MRQIHSSVHTYHIGLSLAIVIHTQRESMPISYGQAIRHCHISRCTATHTVRLLIDALAWPDFSTDDGEHIAVVISRIALQHL